MKKDRTARHLALFLVIAIALSLLGAAILAIATGGCAATKSIPVPAMTMEPSSATTVSTSPVENPETKPSKRNQTGKASDTIGQTLPPLSISKESIRKTTGRPIAPSAPGAVAITFDDGPGEHTGRLLDALNDYGVKVTFFVQGKFVNSHADLILRMHREGHQIGNHTYSHKYLTKVGSDVRSQQLKSTSDAIERITGSRPTIMRPPGGYGNEAVHREVKKQGMAAVYWDIDPADWKKGNRKADYVYNYLLSHAQEGKIILLHDIHPTTVDGFIRALPVLIEHGFTFVTIDQLIKLEPGEVYPARWRR